MRFVERHENADLIWVSGFFAEALATGDLDAAMYFANLAEDMWQGGYANVTRPPGECRAVTRNAQNCPHPAKSGEPYCGLHGRLIREHHDRREMSPG